MGTLIAQQWVIRVTYKTCVNVVAACSVVSTLQVRVLKTLALIMTTCLLISILVIIIK